MQSAPKPSKAGPGCLILFALPFCGAGILAAFQLLKQLSESPADWEKLGLLGVCSLVFTGAGAGMIAFSHYARRKADETARLRAMHPDAPWLWRPEWATGRIPGSNKNVMVFAWVFAAFWNLISSPVLVFFPEEFFKKGNKLALIALLFPAVGIGLLVWAVRATIRWKKFGSPIFEMPSLPGVIGGRFQGAIHTGLRTSPESGLHLTLSCIRRTKSTGRNRSVRETILSQEEQTIPSSHLQPGPNGLWAPVKFHIPYECEATTAIEEDTGVLWRLQADAAVAGVDYSTRFEAPVFKTAESSTDAPQNDASPVFRGAAQQPYDPRQATVQIRPSALGGTEYYFGPLRNLGAAAAITVFFAIWMGALWLQVHLGAPLLFPIVTGLFGILLFLIMIDVSLSATRVVIESGKVAIKNSVLGIGSRKEISCSEIADVKLGASMRQQPSLTHAGRVYYDIELIPKYGKKITAGRHLRNKREAEWLAAEMRKQIEAFQS